MKRHTLTATKREVTGRKVKKLRRAGQIPATVYGRNMKSTSVAVASDAFAKTYEQAGETGLVELSIDGKVHPTLIHAVQRDPVTDAILHVEFYQVNLKEKVRTHVPLVLSGEAPAVAEKKGVLLTILDEVEVEALPTDLVDKIEVPVSGLSEVGQEVTVRDLAIPAGITILSDLALTVAKIGPLVTREAEKEAAEEVAATEAGAPEEGSATPAARETTG